MPKTVSVTTRQLDIDFNIGMEVTLDDPLFELVYKKIKKAVQGHEISPGNITILVTLCMQAVAKIPELSGQQKKRFVIDLIKKIIGDLENVSKEDKQAYHVLIDFTLPGLIDALVSASKGKFDFKKVQQGASMLFSCCRKSGGD